jgi:hypothetical protein
MEEVAKCPAGGWVTDPESPFGDAAGDAAWSATDGEITVTVGGLFPLPLYVVRVRSASTTLRMDRILFGKKAAAKWANGIWSALHAAGTEAKG